MEERFVPPAAERPQHVEGVASGDGAAPEVGGHQRPIDDPRALQILSTEHWSLLTARSLVYNEAFARGGMFLAFLSATLLVLGLLSTATGFSDAFLVVAAILLSLDLFVGIATLGRITAASNEDLRYLQGMNRLRRAYHDLVPGLEPYFITSGYDDFESVLELYGPANPTPLRALAHGLSTMPGTVSVICCALGAGIVAIFLVLGTHDPAVASAGAVAAFSVLLLAFITVARRSVFAFDRSIVVRFPRPRGDAEAAVAAEPEK
jgi:hypothetical protein